MDIEWGEWSPADVMAYACTDTEWAHTADASEDEGVEVDGHRFRIRPDKPELVEILRADDEWENWMATDMLRLRGKVAAKLELIGGSPRLIELSPEQITTAKRMAEQTGPVFVGPPRTLVNDLQPLGDGPGWFGPVMVTSDREPQPTDGPDYHADHAAWAERNASTQSTDGPWRVRHFSRGPFDTTPWLVETDHRLITCCYTEADAIEVCKALNAAAARRSADGPWKVRADRGVFDTAWFVEGPDSATIRCFHESVAKMLVNRLNGDDEWPAPHPISSLTASDGRVLLATTDGNFVVHNAAWALENFERSCWLGWWLLPRIETEAVS